MCRPKGRVGFLTRLGLETSTNSNCKGIRNHLKMGNDFRKVFFKSVLPLQHQ